MKILRNKKSNNIPQSKEKQTGSEKLGEGVSKVTKGTCDALFNTVALSWELIMSLTSKLSEKLGSNDPEIINIRKAITNHHLNQAKKSLNNLFVQFPKIFKGICDTTVGGVRTVLGSGKETIQGLRNSESKGGIIENTGKGTKENNA